MTEKERNLPLFDDPPVVETVLGLQFVPMKEFSIQHYGLFWAKIRGDYPKFLPQIPIAPAIEDFEGRTTQRQKISISFTENLADIRGWYLDKSETRLIQVQSDRFLYNWKKVVGTEVYPQFDKIEPEFEKEWESFCSFLSQENLHLPELTQCEVTYVNHIEIKKGWESFGEFHKVFSPWSGKFSGSFLSNPEKITFNITFVIPNKKGRLHISAIPAIRRKDGQEIIKVELTARGKPENSTIDGIKEWFNVGHEWIVRGFTDLTTPHMHETVWRRKI